MTEVSASTKPNPVLEGSERGRAPGPRKAEHTLRDSFAARVTTVARLRFLHPDEVRFRQLTLHDDLVVRQLRPARCRIARRLA